MFVIALDAMGGDKAPHEVIQGAYLALKELPISLRLVGPEDQVRAEASKYSGFLDDDRVEIVHAPDVVGMAESPSLSFKRKKESSIRVGLGLVKSGDAHAFVSAGNTGAVMAASTLVLGRIENVDRPAIATVFPSNEGNVVLMDMGSTVDSKPQHLAQFALMGHYFAKLVLDLPDPRVGLLNIGEEEDKGNALTQAAYPLISELPIQFIGNVESKSIFKSVADVVVCDGFVGNALLKFGEGVVAFLLDSFKAEVKGSWLAKLGLVFMYPALKRFRKRVDYEEFGGAPLLGVNGVSIIAHGRSKAKAIKNAIATAVHTIEVDMVGNIRESMRS